MTVTVNRDAPHTEKDAAVTAFPKAQLYVFEFEKSWISSMERNSGWTTSPTARSVVASPQSKTVEGERWEGVFHTADMTKTFPRIAVTKKTKLITQLKTKRLSGHFHSGIWQNGSRHSLETLLAPFLVVYRTVIAHGYLRILSEFPKIFFPKLLWSQWSFYHFR